MRHLVYSLKEPTVWRQGEEGRLFFWIFISYKSAFNLITLLMALLLWLPLSFFKVVKLVKCYVQLIMCKCKHLINLTMSLKYVIILENPFTNFVKKKIYKMPAQTFMFPTPGIILFYFLMTQ